MTKSCNLMFKAMEIVASPSHEGLATLVDQLFINRKDTEEYKAARALYDFCFKTFQNGLTRKLLMVYRDSSDQVFRLRSIRLLSENLTIKLSPVALQEIKPIVISCLTMQEHKRSHEAKILGTIVSLVANNVMTLNNGGWDELSDCILSLADTQPLKAFHVFLGLPPIKNCEFLNRFTQRVVVEVEKLLLDPDQGEDWLLALETIAKIGIQVLNSEDKYGSVQSSILSILVKLEEKGMKQILQQRLRGLEKFLSRDNNMYHYNDDQYRFVSELTSELGKRSFKENSSSLQILEMLVSQKLHVLDQESAIRKLKVLLSDDIAVIRKLQPLLISCLGEKEIPENTFKILGQVVQHVAKEIFNIQEDTWDDLRDYITSHCQETEFTRGCYIFRCLNMPLDAEDFVIPVMEKLLPEIRRMLSQGDKFSWVLAFTGAFCAIIHMVEIESHAESVQDIEDMMIESVTHVVERKMESGTVMRAFKDMETIVKEQLEWYTSNEFAFVKRLLQRLLTIQGMRKDSKLLLMGINVVVETVMASRERAP